MGKTAPARRAGTATVRRDGGRDERGDDFLTAVWAARDTPVMDRAPEQRHRSGIRGVPAAAGAAAGSGPDSMVRVATAIQEGAMAYLGRQLRTMVPFIVVVTAGLYLLYRPIYAQHPLLAGGVAAAFLLGCFASYGAGFVGMTSAVHGNVRVANAARRSYREALRTGFQAGTISGMFTVGLGLLGATIIFMAFKENAMRVLVGFGFGGSLVAAFMRVGGGIYTKAADVGADLLGKGGVGIPEDDPRNAAGIADNVRDNVGDGAGVAADVFERYDVKLVPAVLLGRAATLDP